MEGGGAAVELWERWVGGPAGVSVALEGKLGEVQLVLVPSPLPVSPSLWVGGQHSLLQDLLPQVAHLD